MCCWEVQVKEVKIGEIILSLHVHNFCIKISNRIRRWIHRYKSPRMKFESSNNNLFSFSYEFKVLELITIFYANPDCTVKWGPVVLHLQGFCNCCIKCVFSFNHFLVYRVPVGRKTWFFWFVFNKEGIFVFLMFILVKCLTLFHFYLCWTLNILANDCSKETPLWCQSYSQFDPKVIKLLYESIATYKWQF